jgi:glucose-6-phosphate 1-dehydrogenase
VNSAASRCDLVARKGTRTWSKSSWVDGRGLASLAGMERTTERTLVIMGASGDLTKRWLLPGLGALLAKGGVQGLSVIGSGIEAWDDERWRATIAESFRSGGARGPEVDAAIRDASYLRADVTREADLRRLLAAARGDVILYFALPPGITRRSCDVLAMIGVPEGTRLVMEKPFGTDVTSARALNELLARIVPEESVYRVDHYLGMHTVLNILGLRFANRFFEPLLRSEHVRRVEIISAEPLGLEGRARYYDAAGALVDVTQSHLLQLLALIAMDPPTRLDARDLRDHKAQVLRATRVWNGDPVTWSRRGRYTAGEIDGRRLPSYVDEDGVDADRNTETFAEVVLEVDTWRWAGVPFHLRTGKALSGLQKAVIITFGDPAWVPTGLSGYARPNRLVIGIDPSGLQIDLNVNGPGDPRVIDPVTLASDLGPGDLPPYGEVLKEVIEGDPWLSVSAEMAFESWRIVEPVIGAWADNQVPLEDYPAGSAGPAEWPARDERPGVRTVRDPLSRATL